MTLPPVIFDITRLFTRLGRAVPNGIDRVDLAYARHLLADDRAAYGALFGPTGQPRLVHRAAAAALAESVAAGWGEETRARSDVELSKLVLGQSMAVSDTARHRSTWSGRFATALARYDARGIGKSGLFPGADIVRNAPRDAIYLNVSQFPIWQPRYLSWLRHRPDIKPVFFLHDLLPVQYPEFFRPFEVERHRGRLDAIFRHAAAVIVTSEETRVALLDYARKREQIAPPILVAPLQPQPIFARTGDPTATVLANGEPYFVCLGTLEPRKNHLLLLHLWRELRSQLGSATPRMVLAGGRGWENENVLDLLERSAALQGVVVEAPRLTTPDLTRLLRDCRALLMPTFAEGFGLPVAEALAAGVTVIASDIGVFREQFANRVELIDPLDGPGWSRAILARCGAPRSPAKRPSSSSEPSELHQMLHFSNVDGLLHRLSTRSTSCR